MSSEDAESLVTKALGQIKRRHDPLQWQLFDFHVQKEIPADEVAARFGVSVDQVHQAKHCVTETLVEEVAKLEQEMT